MLIMESLAHYVKDYASTQPIKFRLRFKIRCMQLNGGKFARGLFFYVALSRLNAQPWRYGRSNMANKRLNTAIRQGKLT